MVGEAWQGSRVWPPVTCTHSSWLKFLHGEGPTPRGRARGEERKPRLVGRHHH